MQLHRQKSHIFYSAKQDFESPENSGLSQASTCTNRSISIYDKKSKSRNSLGASAREAAGAIIICFVPPCGRTPKGTVSRDNIIQNDVSSTSTSKVSTVSKTSHGKFSCSSSHGTESSYMTHNPQEDITRFSIEDIRKATGNFSAESIIGQGGFGRVYKGKLRDGSMVAVKRAKKNTYEKHVSVEFRNEIHTLSKVEHFSLVKFLGFLEHGDERLVVVEYVGNGTLRDHLDGSRGAVLEIAERLEIAIDVAHAITYLHTYTDHPIIHRDIKASNILLTEKLRAKVADFGFAHLGPEDPEATHISTQIKGTAGYVDPEYLRTYQLTEKSDVYSFGVLLVELVTGRRPIERHRDLKDRATTRWAIQRFKEGDAVMAMDPRMRRSPAAIMVVEKMMGLAFECLAPSRRSRPSMKKCGEVLWGIRKDYREMQAGSPSPWATPRSRSGNGGGGGRSSEREGVTPANIGR